MDDAEIVRLMNKRLNETLDVNVNWRESEVRENYGLFEGRQWTEEATERQIKNSMPLLTINRTLPVIEAISGFEIQNRLQINYIPRIMDAPQMNYNDIMNNVVRYIEQNTKAYAKYSTAFKDMLICGVGATDTVIDYDNNPDGEVIVERVFPAFLFWDPAARAKNLKDADYVVRLKVMNREAIKEIYGVEYFDDVYSSALDARLLEYFSSVLAVKTLGVVYEYQWREKEPIYRVQNPFLEINMEILAPEVQMSLMAIAEGMADEFEFSPDMDGMFTVKSKSDLNSIKEFFGDLGIELKETRQHQYKYYRAIITGNKVVKKAENFTQTGFSIRFMTGQFSELTQEYYGLVRGCRDPQRMLNQTVSDFVGFLQTIPKGGVEIEADAVDDIKAFIDTYTKARQVTVYNPGGLMKSRPKQTPPIPAGIQEMISYADSQIMSVCGVTPELMGMMDSKEMNTSFYKQQIKQGLTTLSTYFDAKREFLESQAELYTDCVRILAENCEGRIIRNITGAESAPFMALTQDKIAAEYDIIVDELPINDDVNQETFNKLIELQTQLTQNGKDVNLMPMIIQYSSFEPKIKDQLMQLMEPPPPPEPDPLTQELLASEINYKNASAEKIIADARKLALETQLKETELAFKPQQEEVDIEYKEAKTLAELAKMRDDNTEALRNLLPY